MNNDKELKVWQVSDCDSVCAYSAEEALDWYKKEYDVWADDVYDLCDVCACKDNEEVYDIDNDCIVTIKEIIEVIKKSGEIPQLATSTEC